MQWFMDMNSIGVTFIAQSVQQIKDCIQVFEEDLNPSGLPIAGYFCLKDIWGCWEECSAYGQGTLVKLANGQEVNQYFTPHLSAIHLMRNRRIDQKKVVTNGSTKATESWSTREPRVVI
ncbi:hypothetical protein POM88_019311 [Heracleum sosnowskyi]|uniref:Uncharacterized protein n=1 Tax=Heracleum sosnowskyi TaxID=360622 RepID=A0AAD8ITY1_9APIA|nr:hypothetical protein POM88_019311 [Heracleum sosnowskyi]